MILNELNWDAPGGVAEVPVTYPDEPIADFLNWLRRTSAWHEDVELVHRRLRVLERRLAEYRNAQPPVPPVATLSTADKRRAGLAKARAAKQAKRAAATVGGGR